MSKRRYSLLIALILCLMLQGSGLSLAAAKGLADCEMDMQQSEMMPTDMLSQGHDHSAMFHEQTPSMAMSNDKADEPASVEVDCCDVDDITRNDCTDMPDCHSCGSMISLSIPNSTGTPVASASINGRWLYPPSTRTFSPPDLWRPPMTA